MVIVSYHSANNDYEHRNRIGSDHSLCRPSRIKARRWPCFGHKSHTRLSHCCLLCLTKSASNSIAIRSTTVAMMARLTFAAMLAMTMMMVVNATPRRTLDDHHRQWTQFKVRHMCNTLLRVLIELSSSNHLLHFF